MPAALAVPAIAHAAEPDPIVALYAEQRRLKQIAMETSDAQDEEFAKLPKWARADDPLYERGQDVPEMRSAFHMSGYRAPGSIISFDAIRKNNRRTESIIALPSGGVWESGTPITEDERAEYLAEWLKRRAEGRVRLRWWIAARRAMDAARASYDEACQVNDDAWKARYDIEDRIVETPATSVEGARLKLEIVKSFMCPDESNLDIDEQLVSSALRDLQRFTA